MKPIFIITTALAILPAPVFAQDVSTVVATVDDVDITVGHLISMREQLPQQYQALPDDVLYGAMIDQLIQQEVLAAEAQKSLSLRQALGLENAQRAFVAETIINTLQSQDISEDDIQATYTATYGNYEDVKEFNASHILVETQEEAVALIAELEGGADFATLAQEHSTGPSGPNGGGLGWFGLGMMVPSFEQAVVALEEGQVSEPVQTQFGWHVVLLNETRLRGAPDLEEVRGELEQQIQAGRVDARIAELLAQAEITRSSEGIDPTIIQNSDLLDSE